ncbi:hypothetical protein C2S51_015105 [Perilla frutescens var. frutescens]|nr:hypothetical protein C2S51_015105 [Perilla frutescens var. frutescens]
MDDLGKVTTVPFGGISINSGKETTAIVILDNEDNIEDVETTSINDNESVMLQIEITTARHHSTLGFQHSHQLQRAISPPPALSNVETSQHKQGNNLQAGLKVVRKHLGKSRSASTAAAAAPPAKVVSDRRDDSLMQLQDGIQGAILHCKKPFNTSREDGELYLWRRNANGQLGLGKINGQSCTNASSKVLTARVSTGEHIQL